MSIQPRRVRHPWIFTDKKYYSTGPPFLGQAELEVFDNNQQGCTWRGSLCASRASSWNSIPRSQNPSKVDGSPCEYRICVRRISSPIIYGNRITQALDKKNIQPMSRIERSSHKKEMLRKIKILIILVYGEFGKTCQKWNENLSRFWWQCVIYISVKKVPWAYTGLASWFFARKHLYAWLLCISDIVTTLGRSAASAVHDHWNRQMGFLETAQHILTLDSWIFLIQISLIISFGWKINLKSGDACIKAKIRLVVSISWRLDKP